MKECLLYQKINDETIQCFNCSHFCKIKNGRTGICGIRQNIKGKLYLLAYDKAVAVNVDPIEKKPFFHFLPGTKAYSFGTIGCNFRCLNCQNYDISQMFESKGKVERYSELNWGYNISPEQIVAEALKNNCASIAYTYTEPTVFLEYALDTMKLAKKNGLKNVWVSNGFMSDQALDLIIPHLDAINIDIKFFDDKSYRLNCGASLHPILKNCQRIVKENIWLEITTLIIPTLSDDKQMFAQIAEFIKNKLGDFVPWHISAFSGTISWKLRHLPDTPLEVIKNAYKIGKNIGLKYVYGGNILDSEIENTYCSKCGKIAIKRIAYSVDMKMKNKKCKECGNLIDGVFE